MYLGTLRVPMLSTVRRPEAHHQHQENSRMPLAAHHSPKSHGMSTTVLTHESMSEVLQAVNSSVDAAASRPRIAIRPRRRQASMKKQQQQQQQTYKHKDDALGHQVEAHKCPGDWCNAGPDWINPETASYCYQDDSYTEASFGTVKDFSSHASNRSDGSGALV
ncbi:uncharacterized protein TRIREDRAFT_107596 [Trichoderma reesei QM6a]|uniref:Predicted protein n=2 Tax=Hypocrea jecorina TaxID=51453 RepID=G0RJ53_HYPJQ|nr:uncharacterized protein TRIREDRAFT_107596 [Trichoderma reesei QM6a]EGR48681.1 predicted protein [Trichoderma reesei QM6a]ETR97256.1 hypothetical protein M419DRAFT_92081 [Trichoderma reesei RUT C-30]